jgi:hypothetical protein
MRMTATRTRMTVKADRRRLDARRIAVGDALAGWRARREARRA